MGSETFTRVTSDELASFVEGDSNICLLYFGNNLNNVIRGSVQCNISQSCDLRGVKDIEASIRMADRIIFRSREYCETVIVYTQGTDKEHRQLIGRACKILSRDCMTKRVGYLSCFSDFQKDYYHLFDNNLSRESSASSVDSCDSSSSTSYQSECRVKAHNIVFQRLTDSHTSSCTPPSLITSRIYLGNAQNALSLHQLREIGITHVVNVSREVPNAHIDEGIRYYSVSVEDVPEAAPQLALHFDSISRYITSVLSRDSQNIVLVHCFVGVSRSGAVLAAHYIRNGTVDSTDEAIDFIRSKRLIVNPNYGLMNCLVNYEKLIQDDPT